jgi:ketosteroid isomerase-like protein
MESGAFAEILRGGMSEENVDRFLKAVAAFNRLGEGDAAALEEYMGFWDPEVRFEPQQAALEGGYSGHDGMRAWLADIALHYEYGHMRYSDVRDLGNQVLAIGVLRVIGRGSGIDIEVPLAFVVTYRDGLATHVKDYGDRTLALEAAGLSE